MPGALLKFVKSVRRVRRSFDFNQRSELESTRWKEHNCRETVSGMRSVIEQLLVQQVAEQRAHRLNHKTNGKNNDGDEDRGPIHSNVGMPRSQPGQADGENVFARAECDIREGFGEVSRRSCRSLATVRDQRYGPTESVARS